MDGSAERREEPRWGHGRPDDETHVPPDVAGEGNVDLGLGRRVETEVMHVSHDADHRAGERLAEVGAALDRFVKRHLATDRIEAWPESAGERFIHHDELGRAS